MGLSFFKSKKVGPFRINASGSGLGVSFGVKGARVNFSPSGTFVNLGTNGIYYRKKISGNRKSKSQLEESVDVDYQDTYNGESIGTVNLDSLNTVDSQELIAEIKTKAKKFSLVNWLGILPIICILFILCNSEETVLVEKEKLHEVETVTISGTSANIRDAPGNNSNVFLTANRGDKFVLGESFNTNWIQIKDGPLDSNQVGYVYSKLATISDSTYTTIYHESVTQDKENGNLILFLLPVFIGWLALMAFFDRKRKRIELYYAFNDHTKELYNNMVKGVAEIMKVQRVWHYSHSATVKDSKYHAGANKLVKRHKVSGVLLDSKPVDYFECNVSIPCIALSRTKLFFLPERILIQIGNKYGSLLYSEIRIEKSRSIFVEDEKVMGDAKIIDYTYKYVNKRGGPDQRFKDNRQIPVCEYSQYELTSRNGLDEVIVTSKLEGMDVLVNAMCEIKNYEEIVK